MRISVVVPTYNEAENLPDLVSALFALPLDLSVLVVDDNSPDGTGALAEGLSRREPRLGVIHRSAKDGLRSAYLTGMRQVLAAGADAVLQMDADLSHDPRKIAELAASLAEADVALGSRYIPGGSLDDEWPRWRRGLSTFGNLYARTILGIPITDVTTGFRLWRASTLEGMPLDRIQSSGYVFLVEMAYMAHCLEYRIAEVPIHFSERQRGKSKMSIGIQAEAAVRVWQVWWHHRALRKRGRKARLS
ncbi:MAG: polyprenol monophosphomannose synthase [Chloroflexota bacterium]